jgi:hypothetical protein
MVKEKEERGRKRKAGERKSENESKRVKQMQSREELGQKWLTEIEKRQAAKGKKMFRKGRRE